MPMRFLILGLVMLVGCGDSSPAPTDSDPPPDNESAAVETPDVSDQSASAVAMELKTLDEVDKLVASHNGKLVVLDLWALW